MRVPEIALSGTDTNNLVVDPPMGPESPEKTPARTPQLPMRLPAPDPSKTPVQPVKPGGPLVGPAETYRLGGEPLSLWSAKALGVTQQGTTESSDTGISNGLNAAILDDVEARGNNGAQALVVGVPETETPANVPGKTGPAKVPPRGTPVPPLPAIRPGTNPKKPAEASGSLPDEETDRNPDGPDETMSAMTGTSGSAVRETDINGGIDISAAGPIGGLPQAIVIDGDDTVENGAGMFAIKAQDPIWAAGRFLDENPGWVVAGGSAVILAGVAILSGGTAVPAEAIVFEESLRNAAGFLLGAKVVYYEASQTEPVASDLQ